jgi:hypothetical protein
MRSETAIADIPFESRVDSFPLFVLAHLDIAPGGSPDFARRQSALCFHDERAKRLDTKEKFWLTFDRRREPNFLLVETGQAAIRLPRLPFNVAQGIIGCLVANALTPEVIHFYMQQQCPIFLVIVRIIVGPLATSD